MDASLSGFIESVTGDQHLRIQDDLGDGYVRLRAAEAQRRQAQQDIRSFEDVVIEMLRNSRDAHAHAIFVATWTESDQRHLTILDDGDGIPKHMHETVFEPFVTSKLDSFHADRWGVHGRGMALYSIRQNVESAVVIASEPQLGSVFSVCADLQSPGEKRDQSSIPTISRDTEGKPVLRGPHNIIRTVLEFAIEERSRIMVYFGSCASIVATLYHLGATAASRLTSIFSTYDESTPYIHRFASVSDAESLARLAGTLGLPISTRTAHRIINEEIAPLDPHLSILTQKNAETRQEIQKDKKPLIMPHNSDLGSPDVKISKEDRTEFIYDIQDSFTKLAHAYYLDPSVEITSSVRSNELVIRIPLRKKEEPGE